MKLGHITAVLSAISSATAYIMCHSNHIANSSACQNTIAAAEDSNERVHDWNFSEFCRGEEGEYFGKCCISWNNKYDGVVSDFAHAAWSILKECGNKEGGVSGKWPDAMESQGGGELGVCLSNRGTGCVWGRDEGKWNVIP